jgi:hypothetical protein
VQKDIPTDVNLGIRDTAKKSLLFPRSAKTLVTSSWVPGSTLPRDEPSTDTIDAKATSPKETKIKEAKGKDTQRQGKYSRQHRDQVFNSLRSDSRPKTLTDIRTMFRLPRDTVKESYYL